MRKFNNIIVIGQGNDWCRICWEKVVNEGSAQFFNNTYPIANNFLRQKCQNRYSRHKFLKPLWHLIFWFSCKMWRKTLVLMYDWGALTTDTRLVSFFKRHATVVYMITNIKSLCGATTNHHLDKLKLYDAIFSFDPEDAKNNMFYYNPLVFEPEISKIKEDDEQTDLFFIGQAKDRLDIILLIFEKARAEGLVCAFYISKVPKQLQKYANEIHYDTRLPYSTVLSKVLATKCIIEPIQANSTGMTLRTAEAVLFNKKLITTNKELYKQPFYTADNILVWNNSEDLDIRKFIANGQVSYTQAVKQTFSAYSLVENIERVIDR